MTFASSELTPSLWCGNPSSEEDGWGKWTRTYGKAFTWRFVLDSLKLRKL